MDVYSIQCTCVQNFSYSRVHSKRSTVLPTSFFFVNVHQRVRESVQSVTKMDLPAQQLITNHVCEPLGPITHANVFLATESLHIYQCNCRRAYYNRYFPAIMNNQFIRQICDCSLHSHVFMKFITPALRHHNNTDILNQVQLLVVQPDW